MDIPWTKEELMKANQRLLEENNKLRNVISRCRCEECGNELGEDWVDDNGILCSDCQDE